jgi:hypothetical protein
MSINYTYEIINVDEAARCMEIVYRAEGFPVQHIGTRIPFEGESLEAVIRSSAPVAYWEELRRNVVPPSVGFSGEIRAKDEAEAEAEARAEMEARLSTTGQTEPQTTQI